MLHILGFSIIFIVIYGSLNFFGIMISGYQEHCKDIQNELKKNQADTKDRTIFGSVDVQS